MSTATGSSRWQELHADKVDADIVLRHTNEFDTLTADLAALDRKIPVSGRIEVVVDPFRRPRTVRHRP